MKTNKVIRTARKHKSSIHRFTGQCKKHMYMYSRNKSTYHALIIPCQRLVGMSRVWSGVLGVSMDLGLRFSLGTFLVYSKYPAVFFPIWTILRRCWMRRAWTGSLWSSVGKIGSRSIMSTFWRLLFLPTLPLPLPLLSLPPWRFFPAVDDGVIVLWGGGWLRLPPTPLRLLECFVVDGLMLASFGCCVLCLLECSFWWQLRQWNK